MGGRVLTPNPEITRVGFTGQDQDVDLGFTDMKGRMYDPLAGRFASADPVMKAPFWSQGLNRYSYAFNDPINNTDPSGFESTAVWLYSAAFTVGDVALLCAGSGACGGLGGVLDLGINLGTTGLNGFPGAARPGMSFSGPVPTAAPAASGVSRGSPQAVGQNGGLSQTYAAQAPDQPASGASAQLTGDKISRWPQSPRCLKDPYAMGCMNALAPLDFAGPGVVIEGGEVGGRLLFNLLRKLIPRALEGSIEVTEKGLAHVLARHIIGGVEVTAEKSVFAPGTNIREIVKASEAVKPVFQQASGNYARIVDAGRVIGTTFEGQATHIYTVITDATNRLVTAFPGVPR